MSPERLESPDARPTRRQMRLTAQSPPAGERAPSDRPATLAPPARRRWVPRLALLGTLALVTTVVPLTGAALPSTVPTEVEPVVLGTVSALDVLSQDPAVSTTGATSAAAALTADPMAEARALVNASRASGEREALTCGTLAYEANGVVAAETSTSPIELVMPLAAGSYRLTSQYGYRVHPLFGGYGEHTGLDFAAGAGTPIHAVADGVVTYVGGGKDGRSGMLIVIKHEIDGAPVWTWYVHMYPSGVYVDAGDQVAAGDAIGEVGSYGNSTGPHLHFEVHLDEALTTVDPAGWLAAHAAAPLTAENIACAAG